MYLYWHRHLQCSVIGNSECLSHDELSEMHVTEGRHMSEVQNYLLRLAVVKMLIAKFLNIVGETPAELLPNLTSSPVCLK